MGIRKNLPRHEIPNPALSLMLNEFTEKLLRGRSANWLILSTCAPVWTFNARIAVACAWIANGCLRTCTGCARTAGASALTASGSPATVAASIKTSIESVRIARGSRMTASGSAHMSGASAVTARHRAHPFGADERVEKALPMAFLKCNFRLRAGGTAL